VLTPLLIARPMFAKYPQARTPRQPIDMTHATARIRAFTDASYPPSTA
jgi:hypothetical protein